MAVIVIVSQESEIGRNISASWGLVPGKSLDLNNKGIIVELTYSFSPPIIEWFKLNEMPIPSIKESAIIQKEILETVYEIKFNESSDATLFKTTWC